MSIRQAQGEAAQNLPRTRSGDEVHTIFSNQHGESPLKPPSAGGGVLKFPRRVFSLFLLYRDGKPRYLRAGFLLQGGAVWLARLAHKFLGRYRPLAYMSAEVAGPKGKVYPAPATISAQSSPPKTETNPDVTVRIGGRCPPLRGDRFNCASPALAVALRPSRRSLAAIPHDEGGPGRGGFFIDAGEDMKRPGIARRIRRQAQPRRDRFDADRVFWIPASAGMTVLFVCHGRMVRRTWQRVTARIGGFVRLCALLRDGPLALLRMRTRFTLAIAQKKIAQIARFTIAIAPPRGCPI